MKTMHAIILCATALCAALSLGAQTPEWLWAVRAGGTGEDGGSGIAVDGQGNHYVAGYFWESACFGPNTLTPGGIFAAKLDTSGNWLWAVRADASLSDSGSPIAVDACGNCYLTGCFSGSADFGPYTLTSSASWDNDIFAAKLDTNGNWLWARRAGGVEYDTGNGIAVDAAGHCYLTGSFSGSAVFGPDSLASSASWDNDIFAAKLDTNGNWLWARRAGGSSGDIGSSIAVDAAGNAYLTGYFEGSADFGPYTLTAFSLYLSDAFAAKLSTSGNWLWAYRAGGTYIDYGSGIALDAAGNCYLIGHFEQSADFGAFWLFASGFADIFAVKLDSSGNCLWVRRAGADGTAYESGNGIAVCAVGDCFLTGRFSGSASFGPYTLTSSGNDDVFVAKLDTNGNWFWARRAGGSSADLANGIAVDAVGNWCLTGYLQGSASFGPYTLTSSGNNDIFVAKLGVPQEANFTGNPIYGPEPLTVQFTDLSFTGGIPIASWLWNFGDGGGSSQQHPTHTYLTPGTFTVSLTVLDQNYQIYTKVRPDYITVIERVYAIEMLTPDHYSYGSVYLEEQSPWQPVALANTGNVDLTIDDAWFHAQPSQFELLWPQRDLIIPPGAADTLWVRFAPQQVGSVTDTLYIANDSTNQPLLKISLTGSGEYVPPKPPENVQIVMNGNDAVISWNAVTQNLHDQPLTPDYYLVFYNGSSDPENGDYYYHGASNTLSYTHYLAGLHAHHFFYRVVAYKYYGRGVCDLSSFGLEPGMPEEEVIRRLKE